MRAAFISQKYPQHRHYYINLLAYAVWGCALKLSNYRNLHVMMVWQVIITMYLLPLKEDSEPGSFWMSFLYTFKQAENQSCKKAHWIFLRHKSIYNDMIKCQAISFYTFLLPQWTSSYYMYSVTLEIVYWTSWSIMFNLYPNTKD